MNKKIIEFVSAGFDMSFGRVTISHIYGQIHRIQVYSDDYRCKFTGVYILDDIEIAVDKFVGIINQVRNAKSKKSVASV